jgi:hypothetical protein
MTSGSDWLDQARRLLDAFVQGKATPAGADGARAECAWCPLCQAAAVVRGERPEVTAALADVLTAAATALRKLAEPTGAAPDPAGPDARRGAAPPPAVQRIELA